MWRKLLRFYLLLWGSNWHDWITILVEIQRLDPHRTQAMAGNLVQTGLGLIWKDQKRKTKLIWSTASESSSPQFYMMGGGWTDNKRELCFLLILYNWSQENRQYWRAEPQQIISHQINLHKISFLTSIKSFLGRRRLEVIWVNIVAGSFEVRGR